MHLEQEQLYYLKFMKKYLNFDCDQIRNHQSMINNKTKKPFQKRAIVMWCNRLDKEGDVVKKLKTGRPRILDKKKEDNLVNYIDNHPKHRFRKVKNGCLFGVKISRRSVNRYAIRNGYS